MLKHSTPSGTPIDCGRVSDSGSKHVTVSGIADYPMPSGGNRDSLLECEPIGPATTILIQPSAAIKSASPRIHGEQRSCAGCSGMTNDQEMSRLPMTNEQGIIWSFDFRHSEFLGHCW